MKIITKSITMKKLLPAIVILFFFTSQLRAQTWYQYAYNDTVKTLINTSVVVHVLDNDSLNPPTNANNYVANPVACDYPYSFGTLQSQNGGTLSFLNQDSILYTPATNFVGTDKFYYGICNDGSIYQVDTATVTVDVTAATSLNTALKNDSFFKLYPNPAQNKITYEISGDNLLPGFTLFFFNVLGKQIKEVAINYSTSDIRLDDLSPGIYFYQLQNDTRVLKTGKIIIE